MKAIDEAHKSARVINEIDDILNSKMKIKYEHILIKKIIQEWRDA